MRTTAEVENLLRRLVAGWDFPGLKRPLDRERCLVTLSMVGVLQWVLGQGAGADKLVQLSALELAEAVKHANR